MPTDESKHQSDGASLLSSQDQVTIIKGNICIHAVVVPNFDEYFYFFCYARNDILIEIF
jgi:hypothetical protein